MSMNGEAWGIGDAAAFVAAIDRELEAAARSNVELVRKGRQTQAESDYVVALLRDVRSDLAHAFGPYSETGGLRADPAVSWRDKIRWISRELDDRREKYPELVAKGRMTEADAKLGIRTIAALRRLYWNQLFMWEPDAPAAADYLIQLRRRSPASAAELEQLRSSEGARIYRELVRKHLADVELEENGQQRLLVA
jgi:hypothetical protein